MKKEQSSLVFNADKHLADIIDVNEIQRISQTEMDQLLLYSPYRIKSIQNIIDSLSILLNTYYSTASVAPFGSGTYAFGGERTNFNIFIKTGKMNFILFFSSLESYFI